MRRRTLLGTALALANASPLLAALRGGQWDDAAGVLERATEEKRVESAVLHVTRRGESFTAAHERTSRQLHEKTAGVRRQAVRDGELRRLRRSA